MKNGMIPTVFFLLSFSILAHFPAAGQVFVKHDATGANNGSSWANAYTNLKTAISNANAGAEIWVAEGTYLPGNNPGATFLINQNIQLYGGFAGTEDTLAERGDPADHPTILSGDLNGNDLDDDFTNFKSDNVETVVTINAGITNATLIDGFTIKGGQADGSGAATTNNGGGIYSTGAPVIRQCTFRQNYARRAGGGIYLNGSGSQGALIENCRFEKNKVAQSPFDWGGGGLAVEDVPGAGITFNQCQFIGNDGHRGSGLHSTNSSLTVTNSTFSDNVNGFHGGGLYFWVVVPDRTLSVDACTFENNQSLDGSGLFASLGDGNGTVNITNSIFKGNVAEKSGGGVLFVSQPNATGVGFYINSCSFSNNTSEGGGAFASILQGDGVAWKLKNSTFTGNNSTVNYATVYVWTFTKPNSEPGAAEVDSCLFENNTSVYTAGLDIGSGSNSGGSIPDSGPFDFTITNSSFLNNHATWNGGLDIWGDGGTKPTFFIENCLIAGNTSDKRGGGFWILNSSKDFKATMNRCRILNNSSPQGAAITTFPMDLNSLDFPENAEINIFNSLISGNSGSAAIEVDSFPNFHLINCTVADNPNGAIQLSDMGGLTLQNTILHNNGASEFQALTGDVTVASEGGNLIGDGSLDAHLVVSDKSNTDPLFAGAGDYHVQPGSPCVDMGVDMGNLPALDLDDNARVQGTAVDIGAYESPYSSSTREILVGTVALSPNPVVDFLNLQVPDLDGQSFRVQVFDAQGKLAIDRTLPVARQLDVQHLVPGIYSAKVQVEDRVYVGRFLKQ